MRKKEKAVHCEYKTLNNLLKEETIGLSVMRLRGIVVRLVTEIGPSLVGESVYLANNKPDWWPENIKFISPTHKAEDGSMLTKRDLIRIVDSYKNSEAYKRHKEDIKEDLETENDEDEEHKEEVNEDLETEYDEDEEKRAEKLLNELCQVNSFQEFKDIALKVPGTLPCYSLITHKTNEALFERFQNKFFSVNGKSCVAVKSRGDGNCLYHSISRILFGKQGKPCQLRLMAIKRTVEHYNHLKQHILTGLSTNGEADIAMVVAFLAAVSASVEIFDMRPKENPTIDMLLDYIIQAELFCLAKNFAYSGMLQVQFISIATGCEIQNLIEDGSKQYIYPCCQFEERPVIGILWCRFLSESRLINHVVPLLPIADIKTRKKRRPAAKTTWFQDVLGSQCVAKKLGLCVIDTGHTSTNKEMICCGKCQAWYHCVCAGVASNVFKEDEDFVCCIVDKDFDLLQWPPISKRKESTARTKSVNIKMTDINSTNLNAGISSAIVDFYVRHLQHEYPCADTHIFTAVDSQFIQNKLTMKSYLKKSLPGDIADKKYLIFPIRERDAWHWSALYFCVEKTRTYYFVVNSLHHSTVDVECFWEFLCTLWAVSKDQNLKLTNPLKEQKCEVEQQGPGPDCGLFMLQNIEELVKMEGMIIKKINISRSSLEMRRYIRGLLHNRMSEVVTTI
ncbi:uncharacterized protein [Antedon mediterranea]|uniref:uncharacterized protein isoform X2 n=1 Tax=Antedon mediterranea TaxID=105859 RepID=UPI003AF58566